MPSNAHRGLPNGNRQFAPLRHLVAGHLDPLQRDRIFPRAQGKVVGDPHRRQQISQLGGELFADRPEPAQQGRVLSALDQAHEPQADLDGERLHLEQRLEVLARRRRSGSRRSRLPGRRFLSQAPRHRPESAADRQERNLRQSRNDRDDEQHARRHHQGLRVREYLFAELGSQPRLGAGPRNDHAAGNGDHQRRDDRNQTVSDRQHRVGLEGMLQVHAVLDDADQESRQDVDGRDQNARDCVPLRESRRAVHGAVEFSLGGQLAPPLTRFRFVDQARVQVRVDRHLLARHRVQGETGRHLRDTHRAMVDHHVLNRDQHQEDHHADDVVAAHHERAERLDDAARRGRSRIAVEQDEPR